MARDYYTISTKIQFDVEVEVDPMDLGEDDFDAIVEVGVEALTEACQSATAARTGLYARLSLFDGCFYPSLDEVVVRHWHGGSHPTYTETVLTGDRSLATMNTSRTLAGKAQALNE